MSALSISASGQGGFSKVFLIGVLYVYYSLVVLDVAEDLESAEFPLAALGCVDGGDLDVAVDGGGILVDELYCALLGLSDGGLKLEEGEGRKIYTRPYRYAIEAPFGCLGAEAVSFNVPPQRNESLGCDVDVGVGLRREGWGRKRENRS